MREGGEDSGTQLSNHPIQQRPGRWSPLQKGQSKDLGGAREHLGVIFHAPSSSPSLSHEVTFEQAKLLGKNKVMRGLTPTLYLLSFPQ